MSMKSGCRSHVVDFMGPGFEHYEPSAMIEWPHLPGASTNQREEFAAQERVAS